MKHEKNAYTEDLFGELLREEALLSHVFVWILLSVGKHEDLQRRPAKIYKTQQLLLDARSKNVEVHKRKMQKE